mmetsp:Transcript_45072/g.75199  ORF Transcript_45072/g.75199 Transcript_45072/m.75199 type:complete len:221 (-) Transcript_45072:886-1548(-)
MLLAQLVEHVGGVEAGVVGELARDHLQGLGVSVHKELGLARDGARVIPQVSRHFHIDRSSAGHHRCVLHRASYNHNSVVQAALRLFDELVRTSSENDGGGLCPGASLEDVEALAAYLDFFKPRAGTERRGEDIANGRLCGRAGCLGHALHVTILTPASAEHAAVGEILSGEVTDREAGENNVRARSHARVQLAVDNVPLSIYNRLVLCWIRQPYLRVILL